VSLFTGLQVRLRLMPLEHDDVSLKRPHASHVLVVARFLTKTGSHFLTSRSRPKLAERGDKKPRPVTILATERGTAWTEAGFRASWRKSCQKAGVTNLTFHDLRGAAVTRLAKAGCTVPKIATITGHRLKDVGTILDSHYPNRDSALGESAIRTRDRGRKTPNQAPNCLGRASRRSGERRVFQCFAMVAKEEYLLVT